MATHGFLETPAKRKKIIALVLDGMSDAQVARAVSNKSNTVTRQAITVFRKRHQDVLAPAEQQGIEAVVQHWIADKEVRLTKLEEIYDGLDDVRKTYGFMVTTEEKDEKDKVVIYDQHFNGQLAAQMRGVLSDAADELGQKPKTPLNVNVDNRTQTVFVRQVMGAQVELG